ncbi:hypothetical protein MAR621_02526 [Maribacter dokdonensis]|nr:hypothetical protein MAR621_02526 [Maribacter dokdonensis]
MKRFFCNSLRSFMALLKQCDGYLGNEGGSSNMYKTLEIPNFAIFSPWISKEAWFTLLSKSEELGCTP